WELHAGEKATLVMRDSATGAEKEAVSIPAPAGLLAVSPDGRLALSRDDDIHLRVWEIASAKDLQTFADDATLVRTGTFSPDSKWVATGGDDGVFVRDLATGDRKGPFREDVTTSVAFSRDGKSLAAGGYDGSLAIWNLESGMKNF